MSFFTVIFGIVLVSQLYWGWVAFRFASRRVTNRNLLVAGTVLVLAAYAYVFRYHFPFIGHVSGVHLTWPDAIIDAPFLTWLASSLVAFLLVALLAVPRAIVAGIRWSVAKNSQPLRAERARGRSRRDFLARTTNVVASAPFVAGAYGLFYGRLNLETTEHAVVIPNLPRSFEGFRISQLSDIHIGPYMPMEEIRKIVTIANGHKADLMVLTGDFVTFDPSTQGSVVDAMSGVRAPYGVYGCLGNHDAWCGVEDSITELFRHANVRLLRGENVAIQQGGDSLNLLGVDFQSRRRFGSSPAVPNLLGNIASLVDRNRVNILLSHNPDTFNRAAEMGIDLSMAGHTHGGQVALEFINPQIAPCRLVTPYVQGWFRRPGGQLYVNRGIGTIGVPIRIGAPPEITVYRLTRG